MRIKSMQAKTMAAVVATIAATGFLFRSGPVAAQGYYIPKPGSAERKAIMNALRAPVQKDLKTPVIFVVGEENMFRVVDDWAFLYAQFRRPNGSPMGRDYLKFGMRSDTVQALLHRVNGKWRVITHATGATDVRWENWTKQYDAPKTLIPKLNAVN